MLEDRLRSVCPCRPGTLEGGACGHPDGSQGITLALSGLSATLLAAASPGCQIPGRGVGEVSDLWESPQYSPAEDSLPSPSLPHIHVQVADRAEFLGSGLLQYNCRASTDQFIGVFAQNRPEVSICLDWF